jgi:hypothetical protein
MYTMPQNILSDDGLTMVWPHGRHLAILKKAVKGQHLIATTQRTATSHLGQSFSLFSSFPTGYVTARLSDLAKSIYASSQPA